MYELVDGQFIMTEEYRKKKYQISIDVSGVDIEAIVVAAIEGGVGGWASLDNESSPWPNKPPGLPTSLYATQVLVQGGTVKFFDVEDSIVFWELTLMKLLKGISQYLYSLTTSQSHSVAEIKNILDDIDCADADVIFQYAMLEGVEYS